MRSRLCRPYVLASVALWAGMLFGAAMFARGQSAQTGTAIVRLSELNSLDGPDMKPWHLKVDFSAFDDAGKPDGDGIAEEWWTGRDKFRLEVTEHGHKDVRLRLPDSEFSSPDAVAPSWDVQLMLTQIVHPVSDDDVEGAQPELRQQGFGKLKLECTMMTQPLKGATQIPLGLFATYCAEGEKLRLTWLSTNINVIATQTGRFQGHNVPVNLEVAESRQKRLQAHVEQLGTISASDIDLNTDGMVKGPVGAVRLSGGVMQGSKIAGPAPKYPENARRNRSTGTVVLAATIGTDGRVHAPRVISSPDPELSIASLIAVEQWIYRPYLLNGTPMAVSTTITVNFNLNHL